MINTEDYNHEYIQQWVISGTTVLSVAPPDNRIVATDLTPQDAILIADAPLLLAEVKQLRDFIERAIAYGVGDDALIVLCKALGKKLNHSRGEEE